MSLPPRCRCRLAALPDALCAQDVMEDLKLGPNGSLLYCMEFLVLRASRA